jgi:hypothetical protein
MQKNVRMLVVSTGLAALMATAPKLAHAQAASDDQQQPKTEQTAQPEQQQQQPATPVAPSGNQQGMAKDPSDPNYCPPGEEQEQHPQPNVPQMTMNPPPQSTMPAVEHVEHHERTYILGGYGLSVNAGGGVTDLSNGTARNVVDRGGTWDAGVVIGAAFPIALEADYIGSAQGMSGPIYGNSVLLSNGVQAMARLNLGPEDLQFYLVGGGSWQHFNLTNTNNNPIADMGSPTNSIWAIPFGGGLSARLFNTGFTVDARFIYRATVSDSKSNGGTLVAVGGDPGTLDSWAVTGRLGYTF